MKLVKQYLKYNPSTVLFTWTERAKGARCSPGQLVGTPDVQGYLTVKIRGCTYKLHRLAFVLMNKPIPPVVDHANGIVYDNRWVNLRAANATNNAHNQKRPKSNTTGFKGVTTDRGRIKAQILANGKHHSKSGFDSYELAHEWYKQKAKELHGEFARFE